MCIKMVEKVVWLWSFVFCFVTSLNFLLDRISLAIFSEWYGTPEKVGLLAECFPICNSVYNKYNIEYTWIKAYAGHFGNELADKRAKEATRNSDICYNKIPKSEIEHQEREKSIEKWQQQWDHTTKGFATKEFFPNIKDRLKTKMNLTPNFTATITAHRKARSYL